MHCLKVFCRRASKLELRICTIFYKYKLYISEYTDSLSVVNQHNILTEINKYYTVGEDVLMHLMIFRS